jgi:hypothetical protein
MNEVRKELDHLDYTKNAQLSAWNFPFDWSLSEACEGEKDEKDQTGY